MKEQQNNRPFVVSGPLLDVICDSYDAKAVEKTQAMLARGEAVAVQWEVDEDSVKALFAEEVDYNASYIVGPEENGEEPKNI